MDETELAKRLNEIWEIEINKNGLKSEVALALQDLKYEVVKKNKIMSKEYNNQEENRALNIGVVVQRFKGFVDEYENNIAKEKEILLGLDPIEACDDILYELEIRRDALKKCYEQVFNVV